MWMTPEPAAAPPQLPAAVGARGRVPASPREGACGLGSSGDARPPRWPSPGSPRPARDSAPNFSPSCASSPFLPASSGDARPAPALSPAKAVPWWAGTLPRAGGPRQGTLPQAGQQCCRTPWHPWGLQPGAPLQHGTHPLPKRQQPPTDSQLRWFPTSPKHTAHFPETANL